MSETEEHRTLVRTVEEMLRVVYPAASILVDIQPQPGAEVPPTVDGFRPDVLVRSETQKAIAEAKTARDLDKTHTHDQVTSFITYLEDSPSGLFVLSVPGWRADRAKTVLRFVHLEIRPSHTRIAVFDQCDLWLLQPDAVTWDISVAGEG